MTDPLDNCFHIIFFDSDFNVVISYKSEKYPVVQDIYQAIKDLEQLELSKKLSNIKDLRMDIITVKQYEELL